MIAGGSPSASSTASGHQDRPVAHVIWGEVEAEVKSSSGSGPGHTYKTRKRLINKNASGIGRSADLILDGLNTGISETGNESSGSACCQEVIPESSKDEESAGFRMPSDSLEHRVWSSSTSSVAAAAAASAAAAGEDDAAGLASLGSVSHDSGRCKPCLFVHTRAGCEAGSHCQFCHLRHKRKDKPRPCKAKRDRYRKLLDIVQPPHGPSRTQANAGSGGEGTSNNEGDGAPEDGSRGQRPRPPRRPTRAARRLGARPNNSDSDTPLRPGIIGI